MGKLALWGALSGLGKGMMANAEWKYKQEFAELEAAREMKLREYLEGKADEREARREATEVARDERRWERDVQMESTRQAGDIAKTLLSADRDDTRAAANRKSEEQMARERNATSVRVAEIGAEEARARAGGTGGAVKFQARDIRVRTFDPKNGLQTGEKLVPGVFDPAAGVTYVQQDDKFYLLGKDNTPMLPDAKAPKPINRELEDLRRNPSLASEFMDKFGYLPYWWRQYATVTDGKPDGKN